VETVSTIGWTGKAIVLIAVLTEKGTESMIGWTGKPREQPMPDTINLATGLTEKEIVSKIDLTEREIVSTGSLTGKAIVSTIVSIEKGIELTDV